ncbi:MAG: hypothetical protein RL322_3023 [Pseudomonadota bacterium]|jgi:acyl-CoA dehydrogenase
MSELEASIRAGCERVFADLAAHEPDGGWTFSGAHPQPSAWTLLNEQAYTLSLAREAHGGIEASWSEIWPLLHGLGAYQLGLPLAEAVIASGLLSACGVDPRPLLNRPIAVACARHAGAVPIQSIRAPGSDRGLLKGELVRVAWGSCAGHLLFEDDTSTLFLIALDDARIRITNESDLAGQPADRIRMEGVPARVLECPTRAPAERLEFLGALTRSIMMVGAIESVLEQSLDYANVRQQFGRSIGRNQALQSQLAQLAGEHSCARAAARAAADALGKLVAQDNKSDGACGTVAVAKLMAGEAAAVAASVGHQVHGALGFTREHRLHRATRRLWAWRAEYGAESAWAMRLGRAVISAGADSFWARLTASNLL